MGNSCSRSSKTQKIQNIPVQIQENKAKPLIGSPDKNAKENQKVLVINQLENQEVPKNMELNLPENSNQIESEANNGTKKEKSFNLRMSEIVFPTSNQKSFK